MQVSLNKKIAIFSGTGDLPSIAANLCKMKLIPYIMVGFDGQTSHNAIESHPHFWTHLGTVGHTLEQLKQHQVEHIIFAGAISRPSFSNLKVDRIGAQWISQIILKPRGDDQLLTFLSDKLQEKGYSVIDLNSLGGDLLMPSSLLSNISPSQEALNDIEFGKNVLNHLGSLDIGQAVVVQQQLVLGIEAIEGTDALICRTGPLKKPGYGPILIKMAKPQQDLRFDQPTIGLTTIQSLKEQRFQGLALQAHTSILLQREEVIQACDQAGLFLIGIK